MPEQKSMISGHSARGSPTKREVNPSFNQSTGIHHQGLRNQNLEHSKSTIVNHMSLFQMFQMQDAELIRQAIRELRKPMPSKFQKVVNRHRVYHQGRDHYREEIIPSTFIEYNKMKFIVRGYSLKHCDYCKYEITLDSDFLSDRKCLKYPDVIRATKSIFQKIQMETGAIPILIQGVHQDDYFLPNEMSDIVKTIDNQLKVCSQLPSRSSVRTLNYQGFENRISNWNQNFTQLACDMRSLDSQN